MNKPQIKLIHGDCLQVLPTLTGKIDAVVTDPPYGIDLNTDYEGGKHKKGSSHKKIAGDDKPFDPAPWIAFPDCLLWGCNHYCHLIPPHQGQWYFWDKVIKNDLKVRIAEGEYAWHKRGTKIRAFRHLWSGGYRASETNTRSVHPSQKPVELMKWCVRLLKPTTDYTILDPYMGSGSLGIACVQLGINYIGIELDADHFKTASRLIHEAKTEPVPNEDRQGLIF